MLAGLPVIVPDFAEEVAAVVHETGCGVLVDTAEPDTVAEAVRTLSDPALRARMGAAGRAAALGRFGWAGEAERLVRLYRELAPLPVSERVVMRAPEPADPVRAAEELLELQPSPAAPTPAKMQADAPPPPIARPAVPVAAVASPAVSSGMQVPAAPPSTADAFASLSAAMRGPATRPAAPRPFAALDSAPDPAAPRLLLDAALSGVREMPAAMAALLARQASEPAPGPPPAAVPFGELPPPSQVLGALPAEAGLPKVKPAAAPTPSAALGSMVQALRTGAPPAPAEPAFMLLAGKPEALDAPAPPPAAPVSRPVRESLPGQDGPFLTGQPIQAPLEGAGVRLLSEAGLSGSKSLPASVAALLARMPEVPHPAPPAPPPITSDVPLVEAGLRAAGRRASPEPLPAEWRLLQPEAAQPAVAPSARGR
jgi:hypothetical protein